MVSRWLLTAALCMNFAALYGQRVYQKIDLADTDETLHFDSNNVAVSSTNRELTATGSSSSSDLNFAPNVAFSPDSSRAFVSLVGSNRIMVFNPISGETIDFITVGDNPSELHVLGNAEHD